MYCSFLNIFNSFFEWSPCYCCAGEDVSYFVQVTEHWDVLRMRHEYMNIAYNIHDMN